MKYSHRSSTTYTSRGISTRCPGRFGTLDVDLYRTYIMLRCIALSALLIPFVLAAHDGIGLANIAIASGKLYFGTATDNPGEILL